MDLSPNDIRNYEFPSQMRGYDKEEVDNLLEQVAAALEEARQQNLKLSMPFQCTLPRNNTYLKTSIFS